MRSLFLIPLLAACSSHSYSDYQQLDLEFTAQTDLGTDMSGSGRWTLSQWELDRSNKRPKGVMQYASEYVSRWHQPQTASGGEMGLQFVIYDMFFYGPGPMGLNFQLGAETVLWPFEVHGTGIDYSASRGFSWTFDIDTTVDGAVWGVAGHYETVISSSLKGSVMLGNDCRDSSGSNINAGGTVGMPVGYCSLAPSEADFSVSLGTGEGSCPLGVTDVFARAGTMANDSYQSSFDLGGDEAVHCDKGAFMGNSVCYSEADGIEADGCTWRVQAVLLRPSQGYIVAQADDACPVSQCRTTYGPGAI